MATNLQLVKRQVGSSVSTFTVSDCFNSNYDVYKIIITNFDQSATADTRLRLLDSGGSEITTTTYDFALFQQNASSTTFTETRQTNQTSIFSMSYNTTTPEHTGGMVFYIYNPYDSSSYTFFQWKNSYYQNANILRGHWAIAVEKSAQTCTGISLFGNTGSFDNIEVSVYGVK